MIKKRLWLWITIASILILLLIIMPTQSQSQAGSSYDRGPSGYSAWYDWLATENISIKRSLQPYQDLTSDSPLTLIQVYPQTIDSVSTDWVSTGHTLVILGFTAPASGASFSTLQPTNVGEVRIDSRRRSQGDQTKILLGDDYGAIAWERIIGKGKVVYVTTPFLAANAYQNYLPNYEFLAQIVTEGNKPIWFDEYIHGYRDSDSTVIQSEKTLFTYLQSTWLFPLFVQLIILSLLAVWTGLHPLGLPVSLIKPKPNNTLTYLQAMAKVLEKANKPEYLREATSKKNLDK
ncbi:MAG: DUF4350 domain-containing protein [Gloeocapsa sp. DLM2.Bin57]|nr:MAG: DUF4350 domain-containing protein [Gloeocapsa sp. DLM2.Bin57]